MPTRSDITVVNSAYDTSGNGGRKLVRLSNGWLVSGAKNPSGDIYLYKSTDNGATWSQICFIDGTNVFNDFSIISLGVKVYIFTSYYTASALLYKFDVTTQTNVNLVGTEQIIDISQTSMGNCSLTINDTGTELHAAWSSKNATYPNSFNIRYAKGTINADGSVTWGSVFQNSTQNTTGNDYKNPTIVLNSSGVARIICEFVSGTTTYNITSMIGGTVGTVTIYSGGSYAQSTPSAIFVPQNINGLTYGRIEVAWMGMDATDSAVNNLRYSYSDDGGVTWSATQKLSSGNNWHNGLYPSITSNKNNETFIVFQGQTVSSSTNDYRVKQIKKTSGAWGSIVEKKTFRSEAPSTLFDINLPFTEPLFIYKDVTGVKVGFYGTWTITTISVPEGYIGTKTVDNINSLLNYSITSDGTMTTVTEKVNGVVVGQGMVSSGVPTDIMVNQSQWDDIYYGKYHNTDLLKTGTWENKTFSSLSVGQPLVVSTVDTTHASTKVACASSTKYQMVINSKYEYTLVELDINSNIISVNKTFEKPNYEFTTSSTTKFIYVDVRETYNNGYGNITLTGGKFLYANLSRFSLNTITVEMGSDKWTYTFSKELSKDTSIDDVQKANSDVQSTFLPSVKSNLASAITSKGGTAKGSDTFDALVAAVGGLGAVSNKRFMTGTATASGSTSAFTMVNGGTDNKASVTVTGLPFKPSTIVVRYWSGVWTYETLYNDSVSNKYSKVANVLLMSDGNTGGYTSSVKADVSPAYVNNGGFSLPVYVVSQVYNWLAIE